jgi:uncharacterized membrane protein YdcZ (DUF606 family)
LAGKLLMVSAANRVVSEAYLTYCVGTVLVGHLLFAARFHVSQFTLSSVAVWSVFLGCVAALAMMTEDAENPSLVLRFSIAVIVLTFFLDCLTGFIATLLKSPQSAPYIAQLVAIVIALAPVWLGPWAALLASISSFTNTIVWISPLTYLYVMGDVDYLRIQWFYVNTPLGGLRYTYPEWNTASVVYILLGVLLWLVSRRLKTRSGTFHGRHE